MIQAQATAGRWVDLRGISLECVTELTDLRQELLSAQDLAGIWLGGGSGPSASWGGHYFTRFIPETAWPRVLGVLARHGVAVDGLGATP